MTVRFYSSIAQQTTLTGTISAATTMISVAATTGFPASTPFTLALDYGAPNEELVDVTNMAGLSLTVTRAVDGTSATTHNAGAFVRHVSSARDFADSRAHENASQNVHGIQVGSSVVGTTDTQSLSNKTLIAPVITGTVNLASPTITGTVSGGATYSGVTLSGTTTATGNVALTGTAAATNQLDVKGAASQSAALQRWLDNAGTVLGSVDATGLFVLPNGVSITAATAATAPLFIKGAASQSADYLDIQDSAGGSLVTVDNSGNFIASNGATLVGGPSPSTQGVVMRPASGGTLVGVFQDSGGSTVAYVDSVGGIHGTDILITTGSAWNVFTPIWTATGTAPAIGNGTLTGRYKQIGKLITVTWLVKFGTTTTLGTGTWGFSYPSGQQPFQATPAELTYCGAARGHTTSPSAWYTGTAVYDKATDAFRVYSHNGTSEWDPTVPVAWPLNANSYFEFTVTYETA